MRLIINAETPSELRVAFRVAQTMGDQGARPVGDIWGFVTFAREGGKATHDTSCRKIKTGYSIKTREINGGKQTD